jgi:hypothetical protein
MSGDSVSKKYQQPKNLLKNDVVNQQELVQNAPLEPDALEVFKNLNNLLQPKLQIMAPEPNFDLQKPNEAQREAIEALTNDIIKRVDKENSALPPLDPAPPPLPKKPEQKNKQR